jgi:hypothetical protein
MKKLLLLFVFLSISSISFSQEKTRVVDQIYAGDGDFISIWHVCEDNNIPDQIIKTRNSFPKDAIKLGWDEGYAITDISYGGGYWSLVMDKGTNFGKQRWFTTDNADLEKDIQEGWAEGFNIQKICFGDGLYAVIMSEKPGHGTQSWFTRSTVSDFKSHVKERYEEDYYIIDLAYTNGSWFGFMAKDPPYLGQTWVGRSELPLDAMETENKDGKILSALATDGNYWIAVMSKVEGCYSQTFGDLELERPNKNPSSAGTGTGFAISSNGYIATNYHVIDGASSITVKGVDGDLETSYRAKVIVEDQRNDLAILKIEKWLGEIPYEISRSTLGLANQVYALGYPLTSLLGVDIKFTDGKIGAITGFENDPTYYQHSAPIQPGNSGGPLFSATGNLIAINTLRVNQDIAITEGIFFSVKSRYLMNLMEDKNISFPSNRGLDNYNIPQQVERIKKFVYLIEVN